MAAVVRAVVAAALMTTQAHGAKEKRAAVAFVTTQGYGDQAALDRVRNVERWLYAGGPVPTWWDIHAKSDLPPPTKWAELGGGNSKRVRATVYTAAGERVAAGEDVDARLAEELVRVHAVRRGGA